MPGVFGPAQTPTTPVEAIEPLIASCSKYSSSMSATDIVNMRTSSWTSRRERPAARAPSRARPSRSPGFFEPSAGGSRSSIGPEEVGDAEEAVFEGLEVVGVVGVDRADRGGGGARVVVEDDRAVRGERRVGRVERHRAVAEVFEPQVLDHLRLKHRDDVGGARDAAAGPEFLGHAGAAEDVAALQHQHPLPRFGEVRRRGQPVMATADDDRVVAAGRAAVRG